jgi:hypothetical protein
MGYDIHHVVNTQNNILKEQKQKNIHSLLNSNPQPHLYLLSVGISQDVLKPSKNQNLLTSQERTLPKWNSFIL